MFVYNNQNKLNLFNVIENKIYVIYTSKINLIKTKFISIEKLSTFILSLAFK